MALEVEYMMEYQHPGLPVTDLHLRSSTDRQSTAKISFGRDNLKNILVRTFKFGMWLYMGNATNPIVL